MNPNFPPGLSIFHSSCPPTFRFALDADVKDPGGFLSAEAQDSAIAKFGIAGRIWEAAYVLMLYVRNLDAFEFDPRIDFGPRAVAVELGAGTGAAGLALAAAHPYARVVLTDLPEVCPLLQNNARGYPGVEVRALAWGCTAHARALRDELGLTPISHIICSDLVYFPELLAPLLRTLLHLTTPSQSSASLGTCPKVIMSYKIRSLSKETAFWSAFGLWFTFVPVFWRARAEDNRSWERFDAGGDGEVFLFVAGRKEESFFWTVPEDDVALLEGVGAKGTYDDRFELLLLMNEYRACE
ncbi:putative methyltransferase-domain-containing protein [Russula earlei]|uniref:Methyltransferase-domain-containing protein n=1 Tax=Russula earlei TaxID=71964 RepID=A0ACC0UDK7_9AGAM|nr:putative methyltransferase-domain-containing protein [Russula earlei]